MRVTIGVNHKEIESVRSRISLIVSLIDVVLSRRWVNLLSASGFIYLLVDKVGTALAWCR
jgi:hypothetical protein